jgi:hypothetical protein
VKQRGGGGRTTTPTPDAVRPGADDGGPPTRAVPAFGYDPNPRLRRRYRVLPRTLLGISTLLVAFAVGAGFSGAVLYSYYQYRLDQNTARVNALVHGYTGEFARAEGLLAQRAAAARTQIEQSLEPIRQLQADPGAQAALVRRAAGSLFFVTTEDAAGRASVGTAFVVASDADQSLLLTSYTTVEAATVVPGPQVFVRHGTSAQETAVTVRTWDAAHDLALIVLPEGGLTPLPVAPAGAGPQLGEPVYALAGIGAAGA